MIENFSKADFEAALPKGAWRDAGIDSKTRQYIYTVTPANAGTFAILVWSSLQATGSSSKRAGKDSIRAIITHEGRPWGGKVKRWTPRTSGWRANLNETLLALRRQIVFLQTPCGACGGLLKPFTVGKHDPDCTRDGCVAKCNKGRQFVSCKNERCPVKDSGILDKKKAGAWRWCDQEQIAAVPVTQPPAPQGESPTCPRCNYPMVRMGSGKGWRCGSPGNRWDGKAWSVCQGAIFDNAKVPANAVPESRPAANFLPPPKVAGRLAEKIKTIIALLDAENSKEARRLLADLL
jgi:hypothetical protein